MTKEETEILINSLSLKGAKLDYEYNADQGRYEIIYVTSDGRFRSSATYITDDMRLDDFYMSRLMEFFPRKMQGIIDASIAGHRDFEKDK